MDKFLETHNVLRLNNEEIENPNRLIEQGDWISNQKSFKI